MTRFMLALAATGALFAVGCAAEPLPKKAPIEEPSDGESTGKTPTKASHANPSDDGPIPQEPGEENPADPADPAKPVDPPVTPPGTTPPPVGNPPPPGVEKTVTCDAQNGSNKSLSTITYSVTDGKVTISKMTVLVTNPKNNNANDIDFWVTPSGGKEAKAFNSGDILPNGKVTDVPIPKTLAVTSGALVRIETNFDVSLATDPSASCKVQF